MKILILVGIFILLLAVDGVSKARKTDPEGPVVKTIQSEDGDIIDCVNIYKQPAFNHPLLKHHKIKMRRTQYPNVNKPSAPPIQQVWQKSGSCPEGTIPILRIQNQENQTTTFSLDAGDKADLHAELAMANNNKGPFTAVMGAISTWSAHVQPNEASVNVIGCTSNDESTLDIIAAGWGVIPDLYGDNKSRVIISWTNDSNLVGWCFNHLCPTFVQTNNNIALGAAIVDLSVYGDEENQIDMLFIIEQDKDESKWWVEFKGGEVGYFPVEALGNSWECGNAMWGGLVLHRGASPTGTQMGNGHFPSEGRLKTGYIRTATIVKDDAGPLGDPPTGFGVSRPQCYDVKEIRDKDPYGYGRTYFYGGAGAGSPQCV